MENAARKKEWSSRFDDVDQDTQLKRVMDALENENNRLKTLVIRLSETIIRNAVAKNYEASAAAARFLATAKSN
jgi:ribosomal protein L12E/L44/L45/RPP1/RPP2